MAFFRQLMVGRVAIALLCALVLAGCATTDGGGGADTVSGYFEGNWYGPNADKPLGELNCTAMKSGADAWDAVFAATFGGFGEYEVPLEGKRDGDKVVFGGEMDLGELQGGVFTWNGEIVGDEFNGSYTSKMISGTFRMKRSPKPTN